MASFIILNQVSSTISGLFGRDNPPVHKLEKSLEHILSYQVDYTIYTDSSASAGTRNSGAAAIISTGSPTQPTVASIIKIKGRAFTSSYDEEIAAMEAALQWTSTNANFVQTSIFVSRNSQSLFEALSSCHPRTTSIRKCISSTSSSIFIQWVPGHSNIPGNDLAVTAAKESTIIESDTIHPTPISCAFQVINEFFRDEPPSHARTSEIYQRCKTSIDLQQIQSRDEVLIVRLCSKHHLSLKAHHHRINPEIGPTCPSCQQAEHTLQHWLLECPAGDTIRQRVFGNHQGSLK